MNEITQVPTQRPEFGYGFSYASWVPGTVVTLCNVPWNSDYRDIVYWNRQSDIDNYLATRAGQTLRIDRLTLLRPNHPVRVDVPFADATKWNYMAVRSPRTPLGGPEFTYYYFITDVNLIAPSTTEFMVQLDVWATYGRDVAFGSAYVERGHITMADRTSFDSYGQTNLTVPEGLDLGGEFVIRAEHRVKLPAVSVMVVSTTNLTADPGTVENPKMVAAPGGTTINGVPTGAGVYYFKDANSFASFLIQNSEKPWLTRGIISAYLIPSFYDDNGVWQYGQIQHNMNFEGSKPNAVSIRTGPMLRNLGQDFRERLMKLLPERYRKLYKFMTSPYLVIELTAFTGAPLILRPENIGSDSLEVWEYKSLNLPSPRISWWAKGYNHAKDQIESWGQAYQDESGEWVIKPDEYLDVQTGIYNLPQIPVTNDGYFNYMASNAHSIRFQEQSADWSQQRAMAGANLANAQSTQALNASGIITGNQVAANNAKTALSNDMAAYNALGSAGMGFATGGIAGGALATAGAAFGVVGSTHQNTMNNSIGNNLIQGNAAASGAMSRFNRDTNFEYAQLAAQGDYANTIAGINAKVQDAKMIAPSVSGQMGGESFMLGLAGWHLYARFKMPHDSIIRAIGDYWLRYGYATNRFVMSMPPSLMVMSKFTYWKLRETYFMSSICPETFKQAIRGIFEKGVTVWRSPSDIGNVDIADNQPIAGDYL